MSRAGARLALVAAAVPAAVSAKACLPFRELRPARIVRDRSKMR